MLKIEKFLRGPVEWMYTDRVTVWRYVQQPSLDHDGTTEDILSALPHMTNVKCRVSFVPNRQEDPKDSDVDSTPIKTQPKIFLSPDADVLAGDWIVAERMADDGETVLTTYSGPAGLPFKYPSHMEFQIGEVRKA